MLLLTHVVAHVIVLLLAAVLILLLGNIPERAAIVAGLHELVGLTLRQYLSLSHFWRRHRLTELVHGRAAMLLSLTYCYLPQITILTLVFVQVRVLFGEVALEQVLLSVNTPTTTQHVQVTAEAADDG